MQSRTADRLAALCRRAVHDPHNADVREVVRLRTNDACAWCLLPTLGTFEVEHIIPASLWDDYVADRLPGVRPRRRRRVYSARASSQAA